MDVTLPLDQMTIAEKLRVLQEIWEDLCHMSEDVPSPSWHADVLRAREERIRQGKSEFVDWTEAKRKIRDSTG